jgi:hypothetical protein
MLTEHILFTLVLTVPLALILYKDRKGMRDYVCLGLLTVILASVWEPVGVYMGLWYYASSPQFFGVSVLTLILYFHWICFSYFIGNRASRRFSK